MERLLKLLRPLQIKLTTERFLSEMLTGFVIGFSLVCFFIMLSKFIFIGNVFLVSGVCVFVGILLGIYFFAKKIPSAIETASVCDSLGFNERYVTAYELLDKGRSDLITQIVVQDALEKGKNVHFKELYKIKLPRKKAVVLLAIVCATICAGFIEMPENQRLAERNAVQTQIAKEIKEIDKVFEEIKQNITTKEAKEIEAKLNQLKKTLKKSTTQAEMAIANDKMQAELKNLEKNSMSKDLKKIGDVLASNEKTKAYGEALANGDLEKLEQELAEAVQQLSKMPESELKQLAESISSLANEISGNSELADALDQLAELMQSSDFQGVVEQLEKQMSELNNLASKSAQLSKAIEDLNKAISQQGDEKQQGEGQQSGNGQQQGKGQQPGNGQQQGNGNSSGNQPGGNGRGQGSIPNDDNYNRPTVNKEDYQAVIDGLKNDLGYMEQREKKGMGQFGQGIEHEDIVGEYKQSALTSVEQSNIPYGVKQIVKEYFSGLE